MRPLYYTGNAATPNPAVFVLRLDNQDWLRGALLDALNSLAVPENWQKVGDIDERQAAEFGAFIVQYFDLAVDMIGMIMPFSGEMADIPAGALLCDGSLKYVADYPRLAAILNRPYGSDQFFLPDMRGLVNIGVNSEIYGSFNDEQPTYELQGEGGLSQNYLTVGQLPAHKHTDSGHTHTDAGHTHGYVPALPNATTIGAGVPQPTAVPGAAATAPGFASIQSAAANIQNTGNNEAVENRQPYRAFAWIIIAQWGTG